jgi:hypothetical protein
VINWTNLKRTQERVSRILGQEAIVAGGAVYDLLDGRTPKDLDVFAYGTTLREFDEMVRKLKEAGFPESKEQGFDRQRDYQNLMNGHLVGVHNFEFGLGVPMQFVVCDRFEGETRLTPDSLFETFDMYLCEAAYSEGRVTESDARLQDKRYHQITIKRLSPDVNGLERLLRRVKRLQEKYVGYNPVFGFEFKEFPRPQQRRVGIRPRAPIPNQPMQVFNNDFDHLDFNLNPGEFAAAARAAGFFVPAGEDRV